MIFLNNKVAFNIVLKGGQMMNFWAVKKVTRIRGSYNVHLMLGKQGWHSVESTDLPHVWPGFNSSLVSKVVHICCWLSPFSKQFFSKAVSFPLKLTSSNSSLPRERGSFLYKYWNIIYLFIYLIFFYVHVTHKFFFRVESVEVEQPDGSVLVYPVCYMCMLHAHLHN